jgi:alpha-L-fucosidase
MKNIINNLAASFMTSFMTSVQKPPAFADYTTPEYTIIAESSEYKWESTRGIGHSFGYNRVETEEHYMKADEAVCMLVDIVSKNGNLLLNVGPRPDGSIPEPQLRCIAGIGEWLKTNGEAIYGTRTWTVAEGKTSGGTDIRYTQKVGKLYAILMGEPGEPAIEIIGIEAAPGTEISLLGHGQELDWSQAGANLKITLPDSLPESPAHALVFSKLPGLR